MDTGKRLSACASTVERLLSDARSTKKLLEESHERSKPSPRKYAAVVIETKPPPNTIPLMLHFSTVLGPEWQTVLYTMEDTWKTPASTPFRRGLEEGSLAVRYLPPTTDLSTSRQASDFFASPWLWEELIYAKRVLLFQTDSTICANSERKIEDYLKYDLIGAPIDAQYGQGYNGGLSLRNPSLFLNITQEETVQGFEDQWFFGQAKARVESHGVLLPDVEVAKTFSVETIDFETPLGYHQPHRWQAHNMEKIKEWCPEVGMLIGRRAL